MPNPGSMSLTATLVLAAVATGLSVAWIMVVFHAGRQPAGTRRAEGDPGTAGEP